MNLISIIMLFISILFGLVAPVHTLATELSTAADNLAPGAWAQLSNPPTNFFFQNSSSRSTLSHLGEGTWDPITRRAYFLGAGREGHSKLHVYDDGSGLWREGGRVLGFPTNFGHGYNHNALDAGSGTLGYIRLNSVNISLYQFPIQQTISTANTWQLLSTTLDDGDIAEALAYFPERGTWVMADGTFGKIREYNPDTNSWSVIETKPSCFGKTGIYHTFAVYLPL